MTGVKDLSARTYGGRTGDERAAARRGALVDAAFALVAEHGWRDLSIEALCRRANLNKRYFYESFDGLDAVIAAVTAKLAGDAISVTLAALDPSAAFLERTPRAVAAFIAHLTDDPRRARVLFGAVPTSDAAAAHSATAIRRLITTVAAEGASNYALNADDPNVELAAAMLVGGTRQALLDWLDGRVDCTRDELVEDLVALWHAIGEATTTRVRSGRAPRRPRYGACPPEPGERS